MKDYIYLDSDLLNSTLAQFGEGLVSGFSNGSQTDTTSEQHTEKSMSKGIEGVLSVGARFVHDTVKSSGQNLTKGQSETIDYVLNDYAVDMLIKQMATQKNYSTSAQTANEGDFLNCETSFKIYDFDLIKKVTHSKTLELFKSELTEEDKQSIKEARKNIALLRKTKNLTPDQKDEIKRAEKEINDLSKGGSNFESFEVINKAVTFADEIFQGSIVLKGISNLCICTRNLFRLDQAQLSFLSESKRDIHVLGVVIAIKEKTHADGGFQEIESDELNKVPQMFHDVFLSNFGMLFDGDRIVKPIAIFFE